MTNDNELWVSVQRFLGSEALALDDKRWDDWLALYHEDAEYWVPAWGDDGKLTANPQNEISLIYYPNRGGLEDRVFRIRTGRSSASTPEMRTLHMFTLQAVEAKADGVGARCVWFVQSFRDDQILIYRGWSEYDLSSCDKSWLIRQKRTVILDPVTDTVVDFYNI